MGESHVQDTSVALEGLLVQFVIEVPHLGNTVPPIIRNQRLLAEKTTQLLLSV